jgi:hypothetical protein
MKTLRVILIALGAPALVLLGIHEIGVTPVSKGFDTGFEWRVDPPSNRLVLTADPGGNMTCWLRLKLPAAASLFTAETSTGTRLTVYQQGLEGSAQWVAIVRGGQKPEDPFDWPAGATLYLNPKDKSPAFSLVIADWYVYPTNKTFDSRSRAKWRATLFKISIGLLVPALLGLLLEGIDRARGKEEVREPFSAEYCLRQLIDRVEGDNPGQSGQMRAVLQKVLIEGVDLRDAVAPLPLTPLRKMQVGFKALNSLYTTLRRLDQELADYLVAVQQKLIHRP